MQKTVGGWAWDVHAAKDHFITDATVCKLCSYTIIFTQDLML